MNSRFWTLAISIVGVGACLFSSAATYVSNQGLQSSASELANNWLPSIARLSEIRNELNEHRRYEAQLVFSDRCVVSDCRKEAERHRANLLKAKEAYNALEVTADEKIQARQLDRHLQQYFDRQSFIFRQESSPSQLKKNEFLDDSAGIYSEILNDVDGLIRINLLEAKALEDKTKTFYESTRKTQLFSGVILALVFLTLIARILLILPQNKQDK